jgi:hypothetical protein
MEIYLHGRERETILNGLPEGQRLMRGLAAEYHKLPSFDVAQISRKLVENRLLLLVIAEDCNHA